MTKFFSTASAATKVASLVVVVVVASTVLLVVYNTNSTAWHDATRSEAGAVAGNKNHHGLYSASVNSIAQQRQLQQQLQQQLWHQRRWRQRRRTQQSGSMAGGEVTVADGTIMMLTLLLLRPPPIPPIPIPIITTLKIPCTKQKRHRLTTTIIMNNCTPPPHSIHVNTPALAHRICITNIRKNKIPMDIRRFHRRMPPLCNIRGGSSLPWVHHYWRMKVVMNQLWLRPWGLL